VNSQLIADLEAARALIDTPEKWWQMGGHNAGATHNCTCAGLAVSNSCEITPDDVWYEQDSTERRRACYAALGFVGVCDMAAWNDAPERTHAEVMALFDRAIANERSKA